MRATGGGASVGGRLVVCVCSSVRAIMVMVVVTRHCTFAVATRAAPAAAAAAARMCARSALDCTVYWLEAQIVHEDGVQVAPVEESGVERVFVQVRTSWRGQR